MIWPNSSTKNQFWILNELYKCNIKGKLYKLLYTLNKSTRITVRTAVGDSESEEVHDTLAQGSLEGAISSSTNVSKGLETFFNDSEYEVTYGKIALNPMSFQNDITRPTKDHVEAQMGNNGLENLAESKLLTFIMSKTCIIIF